MSKIKRQWSFKQKCKHGDPVTRIARKDMADTYRRLRKDDPRIARLLSARFNRAAHTLVDALIG